MAAASRRLARALYSAVAKPLLFAAYPDDAHKLTLRAVGLMDRLPWLARVFAQEEQPLRPTTVGGVTLPQPVIVAAGLVKGQGFETEDAALSAVGRSNVIPGWRSIPLMCGPVEFGSFTLAPRVGNAGTVLWRDVNGLTTMNRVGLKNPGSAAAAEFLSRQPIDGTFGISVATTPEVDDPTVQAAHVAQAIGRFIEEGVRPDWFTVNLSCPNTEQDPTATQTTALASAVCAATVERAGTVPVWVKVSPDLGDTQYDSLLEVFEDNGVRAVVATNTLPGIVPSTDIRAGAGGKRLYERALSVVLRLYAVRERRSYSVDIVGCGGVMNGVDLRAYLDAGALAVQVWSALVFRGPFAPEDITREYLEILKEGQS